MNTLAGDVFTARHGIAFVIGDGDLPVARGLPACHQRARQVAFDKHRVAGSDDLAHRDTAIWPS
jgi:hypothetical protein